MYTESKLVFSHWARIKILTNKINVNISVCCLFFIVVKILKWPVYV